LPQAGDALGGGAQQQALLQQFNPMPQQVPTGFVPQRAMFNSWPLPGAFGGMQALAGMQAMADMQGFGSAPGFSALGGGGAAAGFAGGAAMNCGGGAAGFAAAPPPGGMQFNPFQQLVEQQQVLPPLPQRQQSPQSQPLPPPQQQQQVQQQPRQPQSQPQRDHMEPQAQPTMMEGLPPEGPPSRLGSADTCVGWNGSAAQSSAAAEMQSVLGRYAQAHGGALPNGMLSTLPNGIPPPQQQHLNGLFQPGMQAQQLGSGQPASLFQQPPLGGLAAPSSSSDLSAMSDPPQVPMFCDFAELGGGPADPSAPVLSLEEARQQLRQQRPHGGGPPAAQAAAPPLQQQQQQQPPLGGPAATASLLPSVSFDFGGQNLYQSPFVTAPTPPPMSQEAIEVRLDANYFCLPPPCGTLLPSTRLPETAGCLPRNSGGIAPVMCLDALSVPLAECDLQNFKVISMDAQCSRQLAGKQCIKQQTQLSNIASVAGAGGSAGRRLPSSGGGAAAAGRRRLCAAAAAAAARLPKQRQVAPAHEQPADGAAAYMFAQRCGLGFTSNTPPWLA